MSSKPCRPKLRAKTGCLPCRQQRIKCDERTPVCRACCASRASRICRWPTEKDLVDRRFRSCRPREASKAGKGHQDALSPIGRLSIQPPSPLPLLAESATTRKQEPCHVEWALFCQFDRHATPLLLLPHCSPVFHATWYSAIRSIMLSRNSLSSALMTCAASFASARGASPSMCHVSLQYYTDSLANLAASLCNASPETDDGILLAIVLLYAHNSMSGSSYQDLPQHVSAAMRIVMSRTLNAAASGALSVFDYMALESVLYQVFLLNTGLWSSAMSYEPLCPLNLEFWDRSEELLDHPANFSFALLSLNSPVLGVPVSLMRLVMFLGQLCLGRQSVTMDDLKKLQTKVATWEESALQAMAEIDAPDMLNRDANCLYVMVSSILMNHVVAFGLSTGFPKVRCLDNWQTRIALNILCRRSGDPHWSTSHIGTWPVYAMGLLLDDYKERDIVRRDMQTRQDLTGFWIVKRFQEDLESSWAELEAEVTPVDINVKAISTVLPYTTFLSPSIYSIAL